MVKTIIKLTLIVLGLTAALSLACQKAPSTNIATANVDNKPVNAQPAATSAEQTPAIADSDGSPTQVYKLAYKYRKEKNIEGLKSIFSKEVLDFLSEMGKSEKKSLDDQVREMTETPQWTSDESRNEKISGDHAKIEYRDTDGDWKTMDFVKEGGKWKLSVPESDSSDDDKPAPKR
jgi:hypothetical protein